MSIVPVKINSVQSQITYGDVNYQNSYIVDMKEDISDIKEDLDELKLLDFETLTADNINCQNINLIVATESGNTNTIILNGNQGNIALRGPGDVTTNVNISGLGGKINLRGDGDTDDNIILDGKDGIITTDILRVMFDRDVERFLTFTVPAGGTPDYPLIGNSGGTLGYNIIPSSLFGSFSLYGGRYIMELMFEVEGGATTLGTVEIQTHIEGVLSGDPEATTEVITPLKSDYVGYIGGGYGNVYMDYMTIVKIPYRSGNVWDQPNITVSPRVRIASGGTTWYIGKARIKFTYIN